MLEVDVDRMIVKYGSDATDSAKKHRFGEGKQFVLFPHPTRVIFSFFPPYFQVRTRTTRNRILIRVMQAANAQDC